MHEALDLASGVLGRTRPNPAVGAVIVRDGQVVGRGQTQPPGRPHAEIMALQQAGELARGAHLYVSLEPCTHHGRTPPCTDAIIAAGIARVSLAVRDPNPIVHGRGVAALREAGIEVDEGDGAPRARRILNGYWRWITDGRPWVSAKYAMTLDGKLATRSGDARWITSAASRALVHQMRDRTDAIMAGINTVLADDPALTARPGGVPSSDRQPLRVIVDSKGRFPESAAMLREPGETLVATVSMADDHEQRLRGLGVHVVRFESADGRVPLGDLLRELGTRGMTTVFVEGGGELLGALLDAGLIDRLYAFIAPVLVGGSQAPTWGGVGRGTMSEAVRLHRTTIQHLEGDILISGYLRPEE
jgi:diaminohydroxyphosphoribosylaminopyrimidine deaminase/5-amino-6-(5-phosphoribosylamino)uracil reductase